MAVNLRELARVGAKARIVELEKELAQLKRMVKHDSAPRRRRQKMSAAQRKAVSLRMKKFWAERKKKR